MTVTENDLKNGRIVGIAGPVVDVEFPAGALPEINTQLEFDIMVAGEAVNVPAEVAQQIGDNRVRAMDQSAIFGLAVLSLTLSCQESHLSMAHLTRKS